MINVTVDANILISLLRPFEPPHQHAMYLWTLHEKGTVKLTITTRIKADVDRDPLRSAISALNVVQIPTIG